MSAGDCLSLVGCCFPCLLLLVAVLLCWLMIGGFCVLCLLRCRGISAKPKQGWVTLASWIRGCVQRQIDVWLRCRYKHTSLLPHAVSVGNIWYSHKLHANINLILRHKMIILCFLHVYLPNLFSIWTLCLNKSISLTVNVLNPALLKTYRV